VTKAANTLWLNEIKDDMSSVKSTTPEPMPLPPRQRGAVLAQILKQMAVLAQDTSSGNNLKAFAEGSLLQIDCSPLDWWCQSADFPTSKSRMVACLRLDLIAC
jgi:hypothetical protein